MITLVAASTANGRHQTQVFVGSEKCLKKRRFISAMKPDKKIPSFGPFH